MAKYNYMARDKNGNKVSGNMDAVSNLSVITKLREQELVPVELQLAGQPESRHPKNDFRASGGRRKVNLKELSVFTRQTAAMLDAGVSIVEILGDLSSQTPNRYFSSLLKTIAKDIQEGNTFSRSLARHPRVYSPLYIALVSAGEESGNLAEVMAELASNLEDQITLISKVRQAVSYPAIVSLFFLGVLGFVFLFLLPKFQEIFSDFKAKLPAFTLVILNISKFLVSALPFILFAIVMLFLFLALMVKTPSGRESIDRAKLSFPVFGPLILKISLARLAGSLATLLTGGVTIVAALDIVSRTAGNSVIENTMLRVREGVLKGSLVGAEMKKYRIFPVLFVRMVSVGEDTGKMEEMLNRVAKFFRDEVDATLNILASILEPVLIISLGVVVGIVVLAIYLPIFNLASAMK